MLPKFHVWHEGFWVPQSQTRELTQIYYKIFAGSIVSLVDRTNLMSCDVVLTKFFVTSSFLIEYFPIEPMSSTIAQFSQLLFCFVRVFLINFSTIDHCFWWLQSCPAKLWKSRCWSESVYLHFTSMCLKYADDKTET